jgi:DNA-binding beta-propeller fold protein YncE
MRNLKKISSILILFTIVLALSASNTVHAVGVIGTITVGDFPNDVAYDSGKGEIFVADQGSSVVSVISDASGTTSSPSLSVPEFSNVAVILVVVVMVAVTFCAVALALKKLTRTNSDSKQTKK